MIATAEEIANRIAKVTKSMHKDIVAMYVETILDEIDEQLDITVVGPDERKLISSVLEGIKQQVNGEI